MMSVSSGAFFKRISRRGIYTFVGLLVFFTFLGLAYLMLITSDAEAITPTTQKVQLSADDWQAITEAMRKAEYHFAWHRPTESMSTDYYWAPNRQQGWRVTLSQLGATLSPRTGDDWQWHLRLSRYGYEGAMTEVGNPTVTATKAQVDLVWDDTLQEWWHNSAAGLEQGFMIDHRPGRPSSSLAPLVLEMEAAGNLKAHQQDDAILFTDAFGESVLRYEHLAVTDAKGARVPARLTVTEAGAIRILISDANVSYPLKVDPWVLSTQLTASDGHPGHAFAGDTDISGDVVVAYEKENPSIYVFLKPAGGWTSETEAAKLTPSDSTDRGSYYDKVAIDGDVIVMGDPESAINGNPATGAAYVFVKPAGGWTDMTETAQLTPSDGQGHHQFSNGGVDVSNDVIVVGAYDDNKAYVFVKPEGGWASMTETAQLTASDGADYDSFGFGVSIDNDTICVGAPRKDNQMGGVYVFVKPASGWQNTSETAFLTGSNLEGGDNLGYSVAVSGDVILGGAPYDDVSGDAYRGVVYLYQKPAGGWINMTETAQLTASDGAAYDELGYDVAIDGDVAVAGAIYASIDGKPDQGAVYVFEKPTGGWATGTETAKLTTSDGGDDDETGRGVSIDGNTIVAAAYGYKFNTGAVMVYVRENNTWQSATETAILQSSQPGGDAYFAEAIAMEADTIVVGAYAQDAYGAVYVFQKQSDDWGSVIQVAKLTASDAQDYDYFGHSVSLNGGVLVVGADGKDVGANRDQGGAYIFVRPDSGWTDAHENAQLQADSGNAGDHFGRSAAIDGDVVAVGAPQRAVSGNDQQGTVYLFEKPATGWSGLLLSNIILTASNGAANDNLGTSLAVAGDGVVAGAPYHNSRHGAVYVFQRPASGWQSMNETRILYGEGDTYDTEQFGYSVAAAGDYVAVGAPDRDNDFYGEGMTYLFQGLISGWATNPTPIAHLSASNARGGYYMGWSTAMDGDIVAAGAIYAHDGERSTASDDPGAVYVFVEPVDGWSDITSTAILTVTGSRFLGRSVALDNGVVVAGEPSYQGNQGTAYVFSCMNPTTPANPAESIVNDTDFYMSWVHDEANDQYQVWRSTDSPYFNPEDAGAQLMKTIQAQSNDFTFSDAGTIGTTAVQYYYVLRSGSYCDQFAAELQRSGEFDFVLTPGAP